MIRGSFFWVPHYHMHNMSSKYLVVSINGTTQIAGWDPPPSSICVANWVPPKKNLSMVETVKVNAAGSMIHDKYTHTLVIDIYML